MEFDYRLLLTHLPELIEGLRITVIACFSAFFMGGLIGAIGCALSLGTKGVIYRLTRAYVVAFRVTPEVVLIFWAYFVLPIVTDLLISGIEAGILALTLVAGAYFTEIFRSGVRAVDEGQFDAARALAVPRVVLWWKIVLPQAVRRMMPASINYLTEVLKHTSYLAAIGVAEMTHQAATLGSETYHYLEFMSAIAVFYFCIVFPISFASRWSEKRMVRQRGG
jgi:polar amino acid transport system permease protein